MTRNIVVVVVVALLMGGFVWITRATTGAIAPPITGYLEGEEIRFVHTEASDPEIAETLTEMVDSPVLVVPELAEVPEAALANVYVFTNGIRGDGPLEFQSDVFDAPPDTPGYSPLRAVNLVTWADERDARTLTSVAAVLEAEREGEVTIEKPGVVVNMPLLTWPAGRR